MRFLRLLLLPFSLVFRIIVSVRNLLFDKGIKPVYPIPGKAVCIGNLAVGGTGKSPMTAYLTNLLLQKGTKPAILSRGYGRKTKGLRMASNEDTATTIGDEPFMYFRRFTGKVPVIVAEKRKEGVEAIRSTDTEAVILLDDAFQHRHVKAGLQIVLTTFNRPLFSDFMLPAGNLREPASGLKRADIVVVTKSPPSLAEDRKDHYRSKLHFDPSRIFFSSIAYDKMVPLNAGDWEDPETILLVTGIADPQQLQAELSKRAAVELIRFPDHHAFSASDLEQIQRKIDTFAGRRFAIVTTEKDAVRLVDFQDHPVLKNNPWFYQSMHVKIDREQEFNELIRRYVTGTHERSR